MQCSDAQKNINSFIRETLKGDELRKTYYHLANCKNDCKEVLLDEFSFYTTFNDLDKDLDFNYEKNLSRFMKKIEDKIKTTDAKLISKYVLVSIIICVILVLILVVAIRLMYE